MRNYNIYIFLQKPDPDNRFTRFKLLNIKMLDTETEYLWKILCSSLDKLLNQ